MEIDQSLAKSKNKKLKIFVAGVNSDSSANTLLQYFAKFGKVSFVHPFIGNEGPKSPQHKKGHQRSGNFVLTVQDRKTYDTILSHRNHYLQGRNLICSPFLTGRSLMAKNFEANKRRFILKFVPSMLEEANLLDYLENKFGPVECLFKFKSETTELEDMQFTSKRFRTYNVMFADRESAVQFSLVEEIVVDNWACIKVEKFRHRNTKQLRTNSFPILKETPPPPLRPKKALHYSLSCPCKIGEPFAIENRREYTLAQDVVYRSWNIDSIKRLTVDSTCSFILYLFEVTQYLKPGSKAYALTRKYYLDYLKAFSSEYRELQHQNFNFTIQKKP